jgi:hypothetical protein
VATHQCLTAASEERKLSLAHAITLTFHICNTIQPFLLVACFLRMSRCCCLCCWALLLLLLASHPLLAWNSKHARSTAALHSSTDAMLLCDQAWQ